jgi:hypothetical protein
MNGSSKQAQAAPRVGGTFAGNKQTKFVETATAGKTGLGARQSAYG